MKSTFLFTFVASIVIVALSLFSFSDRGEKIAAAEVVSNNGIHWHPNLRIVIDGKDVEVEPNIGLKGIHSPIHTHEGKNEEGVIHMEMDGLVTKEQTRLGNFFNIWGKSFSSQMIFDKRNNEQNKVKMFVNGKENFEFEEYEMKDGDRIEIRYE